MNQMMDLRRLAQIKINKLFQAKKELSPGQPSPSPSPSQPPPSQEVELHEDDAMLDI